MLTVMSGFPPGSVGIKATGEITAADYEQVLVPAFESAREAVHGGKIRMLYLMGPEFTGYSAGAAWQDTKLGISHFRDWERVAVVSDIEWVRRLLHGFGWMIPAEVKLFALAELDQARAWLTE
ncbi:MAG TPA: STAS/SEC14 domain-containing protein [Solirubrobacteraceae bacterium]|jgi:hypothetical protein